MPESAALTGWGPVLGRPEAARRVCDRAKIARIAPSLGGVETLIEPPAVMSYYEMTSEERARVGIADGLVRLAVGIEDADDLEPGGAVHPYLSLPVPSGVASGAMPGPCNTRSWV